jgi:hypothetical protein
MIFSTKLIETIYKETSSLLEDVIIKKAELIEEIKMFEFTMTQVKQHPWQGEELGLAERDQSSPLFHNIQTSYVGDDPEEDYKEVIVWKVANLLYVTAAVDHDRNIAVKWDVVVFNG